MSEAALSASNQNQAMQSLFKKDIGSNSTNDVANELFKQYGVQNVLQAVTNAAVGYVQTEMNELIDSMDMPQFMKDDAKGQVSNVGNSYKSDTPAGAQEGVDQVLQKPSQSSHSSDSSDSSDSSSSQKSAEKIMSGTMDMVKSDMKESTGSASGGSGSNGSGGSGNWLAILARSLGKTAGNALKEMVALGEKMGGMDSKENPEAFAETQAEFQAQAQIFKMFQEAIGTMIKSIGEGMSSVARKQ